MSNLMSRVLLVDDNAEHRAAIQQYLEGQGHHVQAAGDGKTALDVMCAQTFDLVLMGVNLPKLTGFEVLERMKAHPLLKQLPVIIVSSVSDTESVVRLIQLGADDYLQEPFSPALLDMRIRIIQEKQQLRVADSVHVRRVERLAAQMEQVILPMGIALSTETDFDRLTERILVESKKICHADAGTLYIRTPDDNLRFAIALTESLGIHVGGTSGKPVMFSPLPRLKRPAAATMSMPAGLR